MQQYKYRALYKNGRPVRGVLSALDQDDLRQKLAAIGMTFVEGRALLSRRKKKPFQISHVRERDLVQLFGQLNQLHKAGVPILTALEDLRDTMTSLSLYDVVSDMHAAVSSGNELSEAMQAHPDVFSETAISLVSSGEKMGKLSMAFEELVKYTKWQEDIRRKVHQATRYPFVMLIAVLVAIGVFMSFIVPQIIGFVGTNDRALPLYTVWLVYTAEFIQFYWWVLFAVPLAIYGALKILRSWSSRIAIGLDKMVLSTPILGRIVRKINIARFSQTLSALFSSGTSILRAIYVARETVSNQALVHSLKKAEIALKKGAPLSQALKESGEFPVLATRILHVGEETGSLKESLDQVVEFYNNDVTEDVDGILTSIGPALTVVLGCVIMWVAVAVLAPIYGSLGGVGF